MQQGTSKELSACLQEHVQCCGVTDSTLSVTYFPVPRQSKQDFLLDMYSLCDTTYNTSDSCDVALSFIAFLPVLARHRWSKQAMCELVQRQMSITAVWQTLCSQLSFKQCRETPLTAISPMQGEDSWARQNMCELVQRQSVLLGHLLHLVHSRPAFPLSQTAGAFWHKLAAALQSCQLVQPAELQLLTSLAGDHS